MKRSMLGDGSNGISRKAAVPSTRLRTGWLVLGAIALAITAFISVEIALAHESHGNTESKVPAGGDAMVPPVGGPFQLVDHNGRTVTDATYSGKYLLIFFGFTHCRDVCPTTLQEISMALDALGADARKVRPLFITVDPDRDTPQVLANYVANFHPRITGLTGTPEQIAAVTKAYRGYYRKVSREGGDYAIDHSAMAYLMGPDNHYLTHFAFGTPPEVMTQRIRSHF